jgi:hypothetical protein
MLILLRVLWKVSLVQKSFINMKNFKYLVLSLILVSCSSNQKKFSYIDVRKEFEMEFQMNKDSTFTLIDSFGCNVHFQKGKWKKIKNQNNFVYATYVLTDTTSIFNGIDIYGKEYIYYYNSFNKIKVVNNKSNRFPIINNDTIYFYTPNNVSINKYNFKKEKGNVQEKRIDILEDSLINVFGKKLYVELFGERKSLKIARRNLKNCN